MSFITLQPAYGRDYTSAKKVKEDWAADKDFIINSYGHPYDGKAINRSQAEQDCKGTTFNIRYKQNRNICQVRVSK